MQKRVSLGWALALLVCDVAAAGEGMTLGFHAHEPRHVEAAARIGYGAIRLWDTGTDWSSVNPQPQSWRFGRVEAYLAASEKAHLKILWTIGNTPRWASARPNEVCAYGFGCAAEPAIIENWRRYVRTLAYRFRGRIECYEPWNEVSFPTDPIFRSPGAGGDSGQFFSGSIDAMVSLARVAYEEIKRVDPQACVLSPSFHSSGHWAEKFDLFLAAGGGRYLDVVSQHFYFGEEPEQVVPVIRAMRQVMSKHGLGQTPIWNTEVGVPFVANASRWPGLSLEDAVYSLTLRSYLLNASEGVSRVYWYAWDNRNLGFSEPGASRDFGSAAASAAARVLDGVEAVNCRAQGSVWQCQLTAGSRLFNVVWSAGKESKPVTVTYERSATRWGRRPESIPAGRPIVLDARPVIVEGNK